ncbi:acyl-CoA dehydrogenase family protein [Tropicimonas sp.]|uniref:acyl-CoA dehydrogenase family protein n=1 Tax=Tropicimonas sp. TaxID=2067044 RepID=UPI003A8A1A54
MNGLPGRGELPTHRVENQPFDTEDPDLFACDPALREHARRAGCDMAALAGLGKALGAAETREAAREAERYPPELRLFDRYGRRLDEVAFHPAYHHLIRLALEAGYTARPWGGGPGGHATHAAMVYLFSQVEPGICCPATMTYAAVPALAADRALDALWRPRLTAAAYDPSVSPVDTKPAATMGMAMTEKQGGSDLRTNTTRAEPDGETYRLTGHKWFCSAPMSDGFLTLAQAQGGLTCFLVPRWLDEGRNAIQIQRLKHKLGDRSNASAEIEYHGAHAWRLGEEGDGIRCILPMVHHTRLDTALAPAGLMRAALDEALRWCRRRTAFQRRLIDQPLMRTVLADLALEVEASLAVGLRVAEAYDGRGEAARVLSRIAVALAKYLNNKRAPAVIAEAMECLGGMGYVEDTPMPMLYREAPVNSIWEGSGNVICLDILRTLSRVPLAAGALASELDAATGANRHYDAALADFRSRWPGVPPDGEARLFVERLATLFTASVLLGRAPAAIADGYAATRLAAGGRGMTCGAVAGLDAGAILKRADPAK